MRIAFIGKQDFGKAAFEEFLTRGDEVAAVFCRPEKAGTKPDVLRQAAEAHGLKVFQFASLKKQGAEQAMRDLDANLGVMAYVLQFVPKSLSNIAKHGTIQYHPCQIERDDFVAACKLNQQSRKK